MQYRHEIIALYNRRSFLGSICRQLIAPPTTIVKLPKRTSNGFSSGSEERLPPRLSLRPLANYTFLMSISFGILIAWLTKYVIPWSFNELLGSYLLQVSYQMLRIFSLTVMVLSYSWDLYFWCGLCMLLYVQHYNTIFHPAQVFLGQIRVHLPSADDTFEF